jgi:hypothetical protein
VQIQRLGELTIQFAQEAQELLMPVPRGALADHLTVEDVERGEEIDGAVALVVVVFNASLQLPDPPPAVDDTDVRSATLTTVPAANTRYVFTATNTAGTSTAGRDVIVNVPMMPNMPNPVPPGKVGLSAFVIENATGDDDELTIWRFDLTNGAQNNIGAIDVGQSLTVDFANDHYFTVYAVSKNWVDTNNADFGAQESPDSATTASTVNFERWTAQNIYGVTGAPEGFWSVW